MGHLSSFVYVKTKSIKNKKKSTSEKPGQFKLEITALSVLYSKFITRVDLNSPTHVYYFLDGKY